MGVGPSLPVTVIGGGISGVSGPFVAGGPVGGTTTPFGGTGGT